MRALGRNVLLLAMLLAVTSAAAQPAAPSRGPAMSGQGPGASGHGPAAVLTPSKPPFNVGAYAVLAFEADKLTGADGSEILAWPNTGSMGASGNATATTGTAPKLYANVVNGKPVARFTASRQFLTAPDPTLAGGLGVFTVVYHTGASSYPILFSMNGTPNPMELRCSGTTLRPEWYCGASIVSGPAITLNTWNLFEGTHDGTTGTGWLNGTSWNSTVAAMMSSGAVSVGNRIGAFAYQFLGDMAAMVVVNRPLSTAERQSLEGYLAWKYGIQGNLPAGHPYKTSPP